MLPSKEIPPIALAKCKHPELTVDAGKLQGFCKHCGETIRGAELVEFLLGTIDRRTEELAHHRELCAKYERVILANSINSIKID